jgi:hypothetical protein
MAKEVANIAELKAEEDKKLAKVKAKILEDLCAKEEAKLAVFKAKK